MAKNKNIKLITAKDFDENIFDGFSSDKERIRYMSNHYSKMSLAKSFSVFYDIELGQEIKTNRAINTIQEMNIGDIYIGYVKVFDKHGIEFEIPGVKDEIVCKENFVLSYDSVKNYLLQHDNKLLFEIREKKNNTYIVSVINAYYRVWKTMIEKAIKHDEPITVHIDDLTLNQFGKGGYMCHTDITPLIELTGQKYTHSVFIPGSHIVLNIERDFEQWIGKDVQIVPQKFVEYRVDKNKQIVENSLVGSRKKLLQNIGMKSMLDIYNMYNLMNNSSMKVEPIHYSGTVTGIINSNNKTGIFVELDDKYITGLMPIDSIDLVNYKPGDKIYVTIKEFEIQEGKEPFVYNKRGDLIKCNTRVVFETSL